MQPFRLHKYAGKSALRNKLGVNILGGNLMWIQGLYPTGLWPDIKIFTSCLMYFLMPGERMEADYRYRGHPDKIKCPMTMNMSNPQENLKMQIRVRLCHEMLKMGA